MFAKIKPFLVTAAIVLVVMVAVQKVPFLRKLVTGA